MNKAIAAATALVCAAGLSACGGADVTVNLIARNASGQSGNALLYDKGNDVEVVIETEGGTDTGAQPAFINTGLCSGVGLFTGVPLETLEPVSQGRSTTLVTGRRLQDLRGSIYHIDIQNSAAPIQVNACGDVP